MDFVLKMSLDNAAMQEEDGTPDPYAIAKVLRKAADRVEDDPKFGNLRDTNGNTIGQYNIYGE
jgi:hypothetical protein